MGERVGARPLIAAAWVVRKSRNLIKDVGLALRSPGNPIGRWFKHIQFVRRRLSTWGSGAHLPVDDDCLLVFYDLGHWPITFDFVWVVISADLVRREKGLAGLYFVFTPSENWEAGSEGKDYYRVIDGAARRQRVHDILVPLVWLLPTTRGYSVVSSRREASHLAVLAAARRFPSDYLPETPNLKSAWPFPKLVFDRAEAGQAIPDLTAPPAASAWVKRWQEAHCPDRPYVTITLRYFDVSPERNSNLEAWSAFARELEQRGYYAVVVPETHMTLDELPSALQGLNVFKEAAWHLHLRMALYEGAYLNLSVNTGPMGLCWLSKRCRFVIYKQVLDGKSVSSLQAQQERGIDPRKPLPIATPYQRLVLEPDELDVIRREFDAMEALIDAGTAKQAASSC